MKTIAITIMGIVIGLFTITSCCDRQQNNETSTNELKKKKMEKKEAIYELAINKVKEGKTEDFKNARTNFLVEMKKEDGCGIDGAWRSFFTTDPEIKAKDVLVGMTKWESIDAFNKAVENLMPMQVTKNYFGTFDQLNYLQLKTEDGKSFDLNQLFKDGQVVEFAVRETKEGKEGVFAEKRKTFFDKLATYDGYIFDREFVVVNRSTHGVIICWESIEAFQKAAETVFQLPEYIDFTSIVDIKAYQATKVEK